MDPLSFEQLRLVIVVYLSAIIPLLLITYLYFSKRLPAWVMPSYLVTFLVCALGWELWFTYGWLAGDPVDLRRADILNHYLPTNLNWLLNSLADAGSIAIVGVLILIKLKQNSMRAFTHWQWPSFFVLLTLFLGQNVFVELFLYHDQLAEGKALSWAPLAPGGPWFNPTLFHFNDRTLTLQGQIPWLLMTPLFYRGMIYLHTKQSNVD